MALTLCFSMIGCTGSTGSIDSGLNSGDPSFWIQSADLVQSAAMATVLLLEVESSESAHLQARFWQSDHEPRELISEDGVHHSMVLWGLQPELELTVEISLLDEEGLQLDGLQLEASTGSLGGSLPDFTLAEGSAVQDSGYLLTAVLGGHSGVALIDSDGVLNWWHEETEEDMLVSRAYLAQDGQSVLYSSYDISMSGSGEEDRAWVHRVGLDGELLESISLSQMSHDFVELPEGGLGYIAADWQKVDGSLVRGNKLMERDLDGTTRQVFSAWDHLDFELQTVEEGTGWTHANALDYLPELDAYLLGIRNLHSIVLIDRASGDPVWIFGGEQSDFELVGEGRMPYYQHQFQWMDDGILVFDNRDSEERATRVVEYALNTETMEATQRWEYDPQAGVFCYALGDVASLDSGLTQVTWSVLGAVEHIDASGETLWQLQSGLGTALGYTGWLSDIDRGAVGSAD
jgi:hypothetical protein